MSEGAKRALAKAREIQKSGGNIYASTGKTVPHDFIGPIRPGTVRAPAPKVYQGPVRPGTDVKEFRRTGKSSPAPSGKVSAAGPVRTVPNDFIGPLRPGTVRAPPTEGKISPKVNGTSTDVAYQSQSKRNSLLDYYGRVESISSKALYGATGFSAAQHEKQRRDVLASEKFLEKKVSESSKFLISKGLPSAVVNAGDYIAGLGVKAGTMIAGFTGTLAKKTLDKPIKTTATPVALAGAGYVAGLGLAGASAVFGGTGGVAATGAFGGGTSALFVPTIRLAGGALATTYITKKGLETYKAPTSFEAGGIAGEAVIETAAIGSGLISGQQRAAKIGDWWRTRGRIEIPTEEIILKDVLTGKKRFVESSSYGYKGPTGKLKQKFDIKVFKKTGEGYHVTPEQYWGSEIVSAPGSSEFKGLYVAPSPSVYFAKVDPKGGYKLSLFGTNIGKAGRPAVAKISPGFTTRLGGKKAFVTGVKPEIEAVIPVGRTFIKTSGDKFFKFGGRRVPIDVFKPSGTKAIVGGARGIGSGSSSSSGLFIPKYSIYNPYSASLSYLSSGGVSGRPSYIGSSKSGSSAIVSKPSTYIPYSSTVKVSSSSSIIPTSSSRAPPSGSSIIIPSSYIFPPSTPSRPPRSPPRVPIIPKRPPVVIPPFSSAQPQIGGSGKSFIPQVRHRGKWKTVGKRMDYNSAMSRASKGADLTTSRRIRVLPSNKKPQVTGIGGWGMRKHKFRPYRKSKGKRVPLRNQFIERTSHAIDTPSEKMGLSIAKLSKNMGWLGQKKKKKSKSPWLI